jgi:acyl-CoA hydrolase
LQDRNVHGKIFGGYIMNKAFEIAYVAAVRIFLW